MNSEKHNQINTKYALSHEVGNGQNMKDRLRKSPFFLVYHATRRRIRRIIKFIKLSIVRLFSWSGITASFYYFLFSREFDREHRSVLLGRLAFDRALKRYKGSNGLLRRNIHRLEKGLIMPRRREIFALDYIQETLDLYELLLNASIESKMGNNELHWATDVLKKYFDACSASPLNAPASERFRRLPEPPPALETESFPNSERTPYTAGDRPDLTVSFDSFLALAQRRRSVRWFEPRPVEQEKLDKIVEVARLSPSACNRLPYRFRILTQAALAQQGAELAGGTGGFAHQIPALIVVLGDLSCYSEEKDRHLIYIDASLASMSLMLAAETLGLSTCPINWSDVPTREKAMYRFLGDIPEYLRPIMLIAIGYASDTGKIPFSSKKNIEEIMDIENDRI